jgi:hypothetical protein
VEVVVVVVLVVVVVGLGGLVGDMMMDSVEEMWERKDTVVARKLGWRFFMYLVAEG